MAITGAVYFIGAFVLLAGGLYWKHASKIGALVALLASCSALCGLKPLRAPLGVFLFRLFGEELSPKEALGRLTSAHAGLAAIAITFALFIIISLLFPDRKAAVAAEGEPT